MGKKAKKSPPDRDNANVIKSVRQNIIPDLAFSQTLTPASFKNLTWFGFHHRLLTNSSLHQESLDARLHMEGFTTDDLHQIVIKYNAEVATGLAEKCRRFKYFMVRNLSERVPHPTYVRLDTISCQLIKNTLGNPAVMFPIFNTRHGVHSAAFIKHSPSITQIMDALPSLLDQKKTHMSKNVRVNASKKTAKAKIVDGIGPVVTFTLVMNLERPQKQMLTTAANTVRLAETHTEGYRPNLRNYASMSKYDLNVASVDAFDPSTEKNSPLKSSNDALVNSLSELLKGLTIDSSNKVAVTSSLTSAHGGTIIKSINDGNDDDINLMDVPEETLAFQYDQINDDNIIFDGDIPDSDALKHIIDIDIENETDESGFFKGDTVWISAMPHTMPYIPRRILAEFSPVNHSANLVNAAEHLAARTYPEFTRKEVEYLKLTQQTMLMNHLWADVALTDRENESDAVTYRQDFTEKTLPLPNILCPLEGIVVGTYKSTLYVEVTMPIHIANAWFSKKNKFERANLVQFDMQRYIKARDHVGLVRHVKHHLLSYTDYPSHGQTDTVWRIDKGPNTLLADRMLTSLEQLTTSQFKGPDTLRHIVCRMNHLALYDPYAKRRAIARVLNLNDYALWRRNHAQASGTSVWSHMPHKLHTACDYSFTDGKVFQDTVQSVETRWKLVMAIVEDVQVMKYISQVLTSQELSAFTSSKSFSKPLHSLNLNQNDRYVDELLFRRLRSLEFNHNSYMVSGTTPSITVQTMSPTPLVAHEGVNMNMSDQVQFLCIPSKAGRFFLRRPFTSTKPMCAERARPLSAPFNTEHSVDRLNTRVTGKVLLHSVSTSFYQKALTSHRSMFSDISTNTIYHYASQRLVSHRDISQSFTNIYSDNSRTYADDKTVMFPSLEDMMLHPQANHNPLPVSELERAQAMLKQMARLNASQRNAIMSVLNQSMSLIQGPPGTGKTQTITSLVWVWCHAVGGVLPGFSDSSIRQSITCMDDVTNYKFEHVSAKPHVVMNATDDEFSSNHNYDYSPRPLSSFHPTPLKVTGRGPVLVCAFSNVAVDQLMERLIKYPGFEPDSKTHITVRVGRPEKVSAALDAVSVETRARKHPSFHSAVKDDFELQFMEELLKTCTRLDAYIDRLRELSLSRNLENVKQYAHAEVFELAELCNIELPKKFTHSSLAKFPIQLAQSKKFIEKRIDKLKKKVSKLLYEAKRRVIQEASVVCCTCMGAGSDLMKDIPFSLVIIDECTQSPEAATLIPISKLAPSLPTDFIVGSVENPQDAYTKTREFSLSWEGRVQTKADALKYGLLPSVRSPGSYSRVVLIGDQCQLPPVVKQERLKLAGLHVSLFERLLMSSNIHPSILSDHFTQFTDPRTTSVSVSLPRVQTGYQYTNLITPSMLNTQYRMNPLIAQWPSQHIYENKLRNGVPMYLRVAPRGVPWALAVTQTVPHKNIICSVPIPYNGFATKTVRHASTMSKYSTGLTPCMSSIITERISIIPECPAIATSTLMSSIPILFIDHDVLEDRVFGSRSKVNSFEADVVSKIVASLMGALVSRASTAEPTLFTNMNTLRSTISNAQGEYLRAEDIGVVTPYVGQVRKVKEILDRDESVLRDEGMYTRSFEPLRKVEVKSVDGFQGREKEVIIFSCVRSNHKKQLGFLADQRRLNVAITRAKRGLVVVGNSKVLSSNPMWQSYIDFIKTKGCFVNAKDWYRNMNSTLMYEI